MHLQSQMLQLVNVNGAFHFVEDAALAAAIAP